MCTVTTNAHHLQSNVQADHPTHFGSISTIIFHYMTQYSMKSGMKSFGNQRQKPVYSKLLTTRMRLISATRPKVIFQAEARSSA